MGVSGIIVAARLEQLDHCLRGLVELPGIEIHQVDSPSGRIVVTQEAFDLAAHEAGLRRIQAIPNVIFAELVYHYAGEESEAEVFSEDSEPEAPRASEPRKGNRR